MIVVGASAQLEAPLRTPAAQAVALAEALDAPLLTRDRRLAGASGHHALVELV